MTPAEKIARVRQILSELKAHSVYLGEGSLPSTEVSRISMAQTQLQSEMNGLLFELETDSWLDYIQNDLSDAEIVVQHVGWGAL